MRTTENPQDVQAYARKPAAVISGNTINQSENRLSILREIESPVFVSKTDHRTNMIAVSLDESTTATIYGMRHTTWPKGLDPNHPTTPVHTRYETPANRPPTRLIRPPTACLSVPGWALIVFTAIFILVATIAVVV